MIKHRYSLPLLAIIAIGFGGLAAPQAVRADNLLIHRVQQEKSMNLPARGLSMAQVEQRYGAPLRKLAPRGGDTRLHPVINRWEYSDFIVYFQGNRVIHSVLNTPAGNNTHPASAN
ncbi:MAG: hypothetical protein RSP_16570 [Rhodanobacter sp.]